jgi:hypothetical protein
MVDGDGAALRQKEHGHDSPTMLLRPTINASAPFNGTFSDSSILITP